MSLCADCRVTSAPNCLINTDPFDCRCRLRSRYMRMSFLLCVFNHCESVGLRETCLAERNGYARTRELCRARSLARTHARVHTHAYYSRIHTHHSHTHTYTTHAFAHTHTHTPLTHSHTHSHTHTPLTHSHGTRIQTHTYACITHTCTYFPSLAKWTILKLVLSKRWL